MGSIVFTLTLCPGWHFTGYDYPIHELDINKSLAGMCASTNGSAGSECWIPVISAGTGKNANPGAQTGRIKIN
jgi:hypothetical protein